MKRFSGLELRALSINTLIQFVVRIVGSLATLTTTLLIAYFLGLESVGSFTKVIAFVSAFYLLVDFGFNSMLLKHYFKNPEKYLGNLVALRLFIAIILIPVIGFLALILPHNELAGTGFSNTEKAAITIYSLTLIGVALNSCLQAFIQRRLVYGVTIIPSIIASAILVVTVIIASFTQNFYLLFTAYIFYWTVFTVLTYFVIRTKHNLHLTTHNTFQFSLDLLRVTWPLGLMLFFNFLYSRVDILLLSYFKPATDVGTYGISYRFFEVAIALPTFLANTTYPLLLKNMENRPLYLSHFKKYLSLYVTLSIVALIIVAMGAPLISLLKGDFSLSVLPLQILAFSLPFFFLTSLLQWHFLIRNKLQLLVPLYGGALLLNIVLNILFIPRYSYIASAVITGICEALVFAVLLWYFKKTK